MSTEQKSSARIAARKALHSGLETNRDDYPILSKAGEPFFVFQFKLKILLKHFRKKSTCLKPI
jgi:hypothetical protein